MELHNLTPAIGSNKSSKRVGRGPGSGYGGTSTRGHKGAKSRSGYKRKIGFEGGQMPLYRKLPHRGFNNFKFTTEYAVVNVGALEDLGLEEITRDSLVIAGLVRASDALVKVLGNGKLTKKVVVKADKFSKSAVEKIEAAGGKAIVEAPAEKSAE